MINDEMKKKKEKRIPPAGFFNEFKN